MFSGDRPGTLGGSRALLVVWVCGGRLEERLSSSLASARVPLMMSTIRICKSSHSIPPTLIVDLIPPTLPINPPLTLTVDPMT